MSGASPQSGSLPAGATMTPAQMAAVSARGNVLVVAGAGTGKTRTLIERVLRWLEGGASLDRLLMVTFTEAAAAEMRSRLRSGLEKMTVSHPDVPHYREQLMLLDVSRISTLHSFCFELVRQHFHLLAMDPQLVVLDESQSLPLTERALDAVFQPLLEGNDPVAVQTQRWLRLSRAHGPEALRGLVMRLHRYIQTLERPTEWMLLQLQRHAEERPQWWYQWLPSALVSWTEEWVEALEGACESEPFAHSMAAIREWGGNPDPGVMLTMLGKIHDADQLWPKGRKGVLRKPFENFFDSAESWSEFLAVSKTGKDDAGGAPNLELDWDRVRHPMTLLLQLVQMFEAEYARLKRELGGMDFADLEQCALRLLWTPEGERSPIAQRLQVELDQVFVDEVQDINAAQDSILRAVSREGEHANRFLVGDVKQSIYRFRLADPRIFSAYEQEWRHHPDRGQVIDLLDNFRSSEAVLDWVNDLFGTLMWTTTGGVDYSRTAQLQFGNPSHRQALKRQPGQPAVEICLLSAQDRAGADADPARGEDSGAAEIVDLSRAEREAGLVADRLLELKRSAFQVWDESLQARRDLRWSDVVVLMRSPAGSAEVYAKVFHQRGIPLLADRGGFFKAQEILDLMALLQVLDNPLQDIPLLALLRSPLVGLNPAELVEIRLAGRRMEFWTALQRFAAGGQQKEWDLDGSAAAKDPNASLRQRVAEFLHQFQRWRELLRLSSLTHCLETILVQTGYESLVLAMPRGRERTGNIRRLLDLARQFDPYQRQGLHRFLCFVDAQHASDIPHEASPPVGEDMVRLMSIHRSKGLEFPVVVVADLGKAFNFRELGEDVLVDEEYGLCPQVNLEEAGWRYPTVAHWAARSRGKRQSLSEEMRLLYVATTRARDHLILTGVHRGKWDEETLETQTQSDAVAGKPTRHTLMNVGCFLDWVLMWLRSHPGVGLLTSGTVGRSDLVAWSIDDPASVSSEASARLSEGVVSDSGQEVAGECVTGLVEGVATRVRWQYPHREATQEPVKTTVSVLRKRVVEGEDASVKWFVPRRDPVRDLPHASGAGPAVDPGVAKERGILTHRFIQHLDLSRTSTLMDLRNESARLEREGVMAPEQIAQIDFESLIAFWQSTVGNAIRQSAQWVHRELPFTARLSIAELQELGVLNDRRAWASEEFVVVQGQMDLVVIQPKEIWLIDFKTDEQRRDGFESRLRAYRPQIMLYGKALENIYRRPVTRRWIHFLRGPHTAAV